MNQSISVLIILFIFLIVGCNKSQDTTTGIADTETSIPNTPTTDSSQVSKTVLFETSFEENNADSLVGWSYLKSEYTKYVSFSTNVPSEGGKYSLCLQGDSSTLIYIYRKIQPQISPKRKIFVFSFWVKIESEVFLNIAKSFSLKSGTEYGQISFCCYNPDKQGWYQVTDTVRDSRYLPFEEEIKSIYFSLGANSNKSGNVLIDKIKVEELAIQ